MFSLFGGVFMGWALGANDAANIFGTAVSSKMVKFWTAAILASVFVILGALLSGRAGIETIKDLTHFDMEQAVISSVAAAITVSIMTFFELPISTSQSVVGSIIGIGIINRHVNFDGMGKVVACWFGTPVGCAIITIILYKLLAIIYNRYKPSIFNSDAITRIAMIIAGSFGAYALGANNVANVTAVFVGAGMLSVFYASLIGGLSIALGIITNSRNLMESIGNKLVKLDPFSALIVILAVGITVQFYSIVGVPVSTSQAVVGGMLGIGVMKGANTIKRRMLFNIFIGWFLTPFVSCLFALAINFAVHLHYIPHQ